MLAIVALERFVWPEILGATSREGDSYQIHNYFWSFVGLTRAPRVRTCIRLGMSLGTRCSTALPTLAANCSPRAQSPLRMRRRASRSSRWARSFSAPTSLLVTTVSVACVASSAWCSRSWRTRRTVSQRSLPRMASSTFSISMSSALIARAAAATLQQATREQTQVGSVRVGGGAITHQRE
jgi:hypothetical protein